MIGRVNLLRCELVYSQKKVSMGAEGQGRFCSILQSIIVQVIFLLFVQNIFTEFPIYLNLVFEICYLRPPRWAITVYYGDE